ncbi:hypothetical protein [Pseudomonas sp. 5P_3.1_Bac2]|uniref:hypothetical protein n=1 Tax=Pseudomonas sp. 5P_3.1_Bac2 TaxID=2971617 RepID=UPI0021C979B1|nr:hypothetical protein [Pseudomonas sp. 5P_3.1_Bac2]MCU1715715.1 hypothetical protein [Pseudomonas sp. 5P_3.1_Bac2]
MANPLDRATSSAPEVVGEGCTQRYDPQQLTPEDGTEFPEAAELWQTLQQHKPADADDSEPPGE